MGTYKEINQLFQQFVDKTIDKEDWNKFNIKVQDRENDVHIERLLGELWDYLETTDVVGD